VQAPAAASSVGNDARAAEPLLGYENPSVSAERSAILAAASGSGPILEDCDIIIAGLVKEYPLPASSAGTSSHRRRGASAARGSPTPLQRVGLGSSRVLFSCGRIFIPLYAPNL